MRGVTLDKYIDGIRHDPGLLQDLLRRFVLLAGEMEDMSLAHGDLSHGNILVDDGELRLVDYDGMYVPGMPFLTSAELGHDNYQHPYRDRSVFGPTTDRFSAIVIYLSIRALMYRPALWERFSNGDNLIFVRDDFVDPANSALMAALDSVGQMKGLMSRFASLCASNMDDIPALSMFVGQASAADQRTNLRPAPPVILPQEIRAPQTRI
ncbi:MAG TPA: hypothetical protein VFQ54_13670, partial [Thermomicrobiales bacterium]|nr:hypothetical protein [Thermomicrobiales bacterium]